MTQEMRSDGSWSTQALADFADAVNSFPDEASALQGGVERALQALEADYCAVLREGSTLASVGAGSADPQGSGVSVASGPLDGDPPAHLVVLRRKLSIDQDEAMLVRGMARVLALRLRTLETLATLRERQALLERLSRIQQGIARRVDLGEVLDFIVEGARDLLDEANAALRLVDPNDPQTMEIVSAVGFDDELLDTIRRGHVGEGAGGRAIAEGRLVLIEDYDDASRRLPGIPVGSVQAAMAVPVRDTGQVVGSLVVASYEPGRRYSRSEQEMLLAFADHASIAVTDARMVAKAVHQSVHDALTDLPNRTLFHDRVEHALAGAKRRGSQVAVLFLDLDRFKHINDVHGHHAGDELLVGVARRLRHSLRAGDTIARLGGDEFAVLLEDIGEVADATGVAEHIASALTRPFAVAGREHFVTASIGIALSHERADAPDMLLRNADAAMYRAKEKGRAGYELFDEDMRARMTYRLQVESELQAALDEDQLELWFQPLVTLPDRRLVGAEALLRWNHPVRGLLAAGEFIPVAEESGLIVPLGLWALERACATSADWQARWPDLPPLSVSVNLSARQLAQPRLAGAIGEILGRTRVEPQNLVLEITESVLLDDAETPRATLLALRELGVQLALDDFGTGYASLAYLRRLPLTGLKVDRSFVNGLGTDPEATAIVEAVCGIARGMSLELTAEGVETEEQLAELARIGYPRAQGYLFARPLAPAEFANFARSRSAAAASSR